MQAKPLPSGDRTKPSLRSGIAVAPSVHHLLSSLGQRQVLPVDRMVRHQWTSDWWGL
eukprot:COSAG02_NODE_3525_length_6615_cov_2.025629_1_plen_57_part_00